MKPPRRPNDPAALVLTAAMLWGELTLRDDKRFYRQGSDEPVCDMPTMARMVTAGWFKVTGRKTVAITTDGRAVERAVHGDTGRIVRRR